MKKNVRYTLLLFFTMYLCGACKKTPLPFPLMLVTKVTAYEPGSSQLRYVRTYSYNIAGKTAQMTETDFNALQRSFQFYYNPANKRLDSVHISNTTTTPVWYSYGADGRLASFFGPSFLPYFGVTLRYDVPYHPTGTGPVAQLTARADGVKQLRQTSFFTDANDDAYKIIRGSYYMFTDEYIYYLTYSDITNPEHPLFRTALISEYPTIGLLLREEPELISRHLPATSARQHNTGPVETAVTYAYDKDRYGRVVKAYIVQDGVRLLIKKYEY